MKGVTKRSVKPSTGRTSYLPCPRLASTTMWSLSNCTCRNTERSFCLPVLMLYTVSLKGSIMCVWGGGGGGNTAFRLSEFRLFRCVFFFICFVFSFKRVTSSANLKFACFSLSTMIPLELCAFLKTSSITAVYSLGESGSSCLTPVYREFITH